MGRKMASTNKAFDQRIILPILLMTFFAMLQGQSQCAKLLQDTVEGDEDLINTTCKNTLHFQLCVSSLRSDPRSATSDLRGLAEIALTQSKAYGDQTLSYVNELKSSAANGSDANRYMNNCLSDCFEEYKEAIENLKDSEEALGSGDYERVDVLVSASITDAETCEDGFKELLGSGDNDNNSTFPLTQRNRCFSELCSNFLAIMKLLV